MHRDLQGLVDRLKRVYGDRLVSVTLYGSAAAEDLHTRFSDFNVFCVLSRVTPRELSDAEEIFEWWHERGNPSPLLMAEAEVVRSVDSFPIEFHDMQECRRVLHGRDIVSEVPLDDTHYRAWVEHELRAKILRLRQKAATLMTDGELLNTLMTDSVKTFLILGRHVLRLSGVNPAPVAKRDIAEALGDKLEFDGRPILRLLDAREGKTKLSQGEAAPLFEQYLGSTEKLVEAVDRLKR